MWKSSSTIPSHSWNFISLIRSEMKVKSFHQKEKVLQKIEVFTLQFASHGNGAPKYFKHAEMWEAVVIHTPPSPVRLEPSRSSDTGLIMDGGYEFV